MANWSKFTRELFVDWTAMGAGIWAAEKIIGKNFTSTIIGIVVGLTASRGINAAADEQVIKESKETSMEVSYSLPKQEKIKKDFANDYLESKNQQQEKPIERAV